jgi:hypothetical protein
VATIELTKDNFAPVVERVPAANRDLVFAKAALEDLVGQVRTINMAAVHREVAARQPTRA